MGESEKREKLVRERERGRRAQRNRKERGATLERQPQNVASNIKTRAFH